MIQADITNGSGLSEEHQQGIKRVKKNLCLVLVQVHWSSSMIMSRHRSLGFGWGQALALVLGQNTVIPGWGSGQTEREAKGSRGKRPGAYTPSPASTWSPGTILAKMFPRANLKEMMLKGHILCCNWQSAYFNSTPFQRESQISLIEILIERS